MNLTTENTAVVLDSTSDYPDAPSRFPNMRFVPLYVRFGDETFRDYVELAPDAFFEKLRSSAVLPATSQPTPQDFVTTYESLAGYERILVPELNSGHLLRLVRADFLVPAIGLNKVAGEPFHITEIESKIEQMLEQAP